MDIKSKRNSFKNRQYDIEGNEVNKQPKNTV